ncbi:MAG: YihY/virulence factor BrkB family protein [Proteobacteria bacterium]|nr:YihY/virulence factor BrkB family protein [Pseudomonadota bacterium]
MPRGYLLGLATAMNALVRRIEAWLDDSESTVAVWLRAAREALLGEMPVLAAGTALYAILATIPTMAAAVGLYSVVANPHQIQDHLASLASVLPKGVAQFIGDQLERQASRSSGELGLAIVMSSLVAIFSARGAARGLIDTLNRAYRVREQRGRISKFLTTLAISASTLVGLLLFFAIIVALPSLVSMTELSRWSILTVVRWPFLFVVIFGALVALYRFGPSPRPLGLRIHVWPGAAIGTVLLFVVSLGLSFWVENVANYAILYGAFGSVVVIILWFYFSVIALVLGGFVNAELERHHGAPEPDRSMC